MIVTNISLRFASPGDAHWLAMIDKLCFSVPWSEIAFYQELTINKSSLYLIAEQKGQIVGYIGTWIILDEAHITNVAVHPSFRRQGIAKILISALIKQASMRGARQQTLEVRVSNTPAIVLYQSMGFVISGTRKNYYSDNNEDALIMWRTN